MVLKSVFNLLRSPWLYKVGKKVATILIGMEEFKRREKIKANRELYEERERRVLDAITMRKKPDRVPIAVGGLNFLPAKYASITCAEYMYDHKKMKAAYLKFNDDFNFDLTFPSFMLSLGKFMQASRSNLIKIPGRDLTANSCYQFNEFERLKAEEYDEFLQRGFDFLVDTIVPRISNIFKMGRIKRAAYLGRTILEFMKFVNMSTRMLAECKARGHYNLMTGIAFPPFDIMSFIFRDLTGLTRDMMKKTTRVQLIEILERMETCLTPFVCGVPQMTGLTGIFFPSERAFSLSPRQFGQYYWPTLKKMIISAVKAGNIPFLAWESDVTHLVHYLLELPRSISRRCCFMCDTSDIFEVNRILDGHMCIMGNIPLSTMCVGTPKDVDNYCKKMFAELKPGGGFITCSALGIPDEAKPENVHAMINYALKHGNYN